MAAARRIPAASSAGDLRSAAKEEDGKAKLISVVSWNRQPGE
jgi:hypothetical protein